MCQSIGLLTTGSGDLAMTVVLEDMTRDGEGKLDSRTLRATQAYRRENGDWRLISATPTPSLPRTKRESSPSVGRNGP